MVSVSSTKQAGWPVIRGYMLRVPEATSVYLQYGACKLRAQTVSGFGYPTLRVVLTAIGILTTKCILAQGFHYPFHLLLMHTLATLVLESARWLWDRLGTRPLDTSVRVELYTTDAVARQATTLHVLRRCLYTLCATVALLCEYQALFHSTALPALAMLLAPDWTRGLLHVYHHSRQMRAWTIARGLVYCGGVVLIYASDQKLSSPGLALSVLSIIFGSIIRSLDTWAGILSRDRLSFSICNNVQWQSGFSTIICIVLSTFVMIRRHEHPIYTPVNLGSLGAVLVINVITSSLALWGNPSMFRQADLVGISSSLCTFSCKASVRHFIVSVSFVGLVTIGNGFSGRLLWGSGWQYTGFVISLAAVSIYGMKPRHKPIRLLVGNRCQDTSNTILPQTGDADTHNRPSYDITTTTDAGRPRYLRLGLVLLLSTFALGAPVLIHWRLRWMSQGWPNQTAGVDVLSTTPTPMDFVISRFDESADEVARQLNPILELPVIRRRRTRIIVYSTGTGDQVAFHDELQHALHAGVGEVVIEHRSNVGREGAAFLYHICARWEELSHHTLFMQAELHDIQHVQRRLQSYLVPETGFLSLARLQEYCLNCDECWDHSTWSETREIIEDIYSRANAGAKCKSFTLTYRGQFVVSKKRIRSQGIEFFQSLLDDLTDPSSDKHSLEYVGKPWLPQKRDSMNSPLFGYTVERLWGVIMQCPDLRLALACPSMLLSPYTASTLRAGSITLDECQCLDPMS